MSTDKRTKHVAVYMTNEEEQSVRHLAWENGYHSLSRFILEVLILPEIETNGSAQVSRLNDS